MDFDSAISTYTDERLTNLAGGIAFYLERNTPIDTSELRPPTLRVSIGNRHPERVNAFCVRTKTGTEIVVGVGLCAFLHHYTRAAATYFLPSTPGGTRPSDLWPEALAAVSSMVEWLSSPSRSPRFPDFPTTPHQTKVAEVFGEYALRFVLCHEMAHSSSGHDPVAATPIGKDQSNEVDLLRWSQNQEIEADMLGLGLQLGSLPDQSQVVNGIASASYTTHAMELLNLRLMLLAKLVDYTRWQTKLTHPPLLLRSMMLMKTAEKLVKGGGEGLHSLHGQLATLNNEVIGQAGRQQEEFAAAVEKILEEETERSLPSLREEDRSFLDVKTRLRLRATDPPPAIRPRVLELFEQSPLGVLNTLDTRRLALGEELAQPQLAYAALSERVASELPPEFTSFLNLSGAERTDAILRIPSSSSQI